MSWTGAAALAQPRPHPDKPGVSSASPSLGQAVEAAWQRALQASEATAELARARAEQRASAAWWAAPPSVELDYATGRIRGDGDERETEIGVSVPMWLPGQRQARGRAAEAALDAAEVGAAAARLRVAGQVRDAAWAVAGLKVEVDSMSSRHRSLQALAADVDRRVSAGELARADALAARAEVLLVQGLRVEALARVKAAEADWKALTGLEQSADPSESMVQASMPADIEGHPELASAKGRVEVARKRLDLVGRSRRAPPEVMAWYRNESRGPVTPSSNIVGLGVRLPLSTDDRNLPLLTAAASEHDLAQAAERVLRERLLAEVAGARSALEGAEAQLASERSRAAMLRERTRLVSRAFRAGETSLPETLRTLAASTQAESNLARQQAAVGLAHARLKHALGLMP